MLLPNCLIKKHLLFFTSSQTRDLGTVVISLLSPLSRMCTGAHPTPWHPQEAAPPGLHHIAPASFSPDRITAIAPSPSPAAAFASASCPHACSLTPAALLCFARVAPAPFCYIHARRTSARAATGPTKRRTSRDKVREGKLRWLGLPAGWRRRRRFTRSAAEEVELPDAMPRPPTVVLRAPAAFLGDPLSERHFPPDPARFGRPLPTAPPQALARPPQV